MRDPRARQRWMSVLAQAAPEDIAKSWDELDERPAYRLLCGPEVGAVMVQGRAGGTGSPFCLGEMTVTRCSVALEDGQVGHAHVQGRSEPHAERAAVFDALLLDPARRSSLEARVVEWLAERREAVRRRIAARVDQTRVEFFTRVRGEE